MKINIKSLSWVIEKYIGNKINEYKKLEQNIYKSIDDEKLSLIVEQVKNKFNVEVSKGLVKSIETNKMQNHMIKMHKHLINLSDKIMGDYNKYADIIKLVKKYDGSPLNLLRIIFKNKYNQKLTSLIKNKFLLSSIDLRELEIGINNDSYALVNQDKILASSNKFEIEISNILVSNSIKFKTQEQLKKNSPTNTPDFLILSDLEINGIKINWIDAKNYYGTNSNFLKKSIEKQTSKYINTWGSGALIFSLGFSSKLYFENILLIDFESFSKSNKL